MNLEQKIQQIREAANTGVPLNRIDIKGSGNAARRLIAGGKSSPKKVEEMFGNLLAFRQFELQQRNQQHLDILPDPSLSNDQKRNLILEAVSKGIPKGRIDSKGGGKAVTRLQRGYNVTQPKLDDMYLNLLSFAGHHVDHSSFASSCPSCHRLSEKVHSLDSIISSLFDRIASLEAALALLHKALDQKKAASKPPKILGASLVRKTDIIHGKKYSRWYALYSLLGKRHFIYIGNDVSKAKAKIQAWLDSHPSGV